GVAVDTVEFETEMREQRERARRDAKSKRAVVSLAELPAVRSVFTGYGGLEADGEIVAMLLGDRPVDTLQAGDHGILILDRTPFYAERGGQIGDRGRFTLEDGSVFDVDDTQYMGEAIAHHGVVKSGEFVVGARAHGSVYDWWRREIRRHHTSAHLLQRALKDVLGDEVTQAGSWVGIDRMRFDFRNPAGALSPEQRRAVAARVNEMIRDDSPVITRELPIDEAKQSGAIWMFGEKYGETVRVLQAGPSVEFCGGTHAHSTGELGLFLILSESSIGSGIRRIESCVSQSSERFVVNQQELVGELATSLSTTPEELGDRVSKLQREMRDLQTAVGQMKARMAAFEAQSYLEGAERKGERTFVGAVVHEANAEAIRHLSSALRSRLPSGVIALAGVDDGAVSLLVSASDDLVKGGVHAGNLVKLAAPLVGGKGGGAATQAQGGGKNTAGAEAAVRAIRDAVLSS
ncbi:MAG TPA: alanine--tRNA ligase-related protein, partial [Alphaproteobacteria bacterium]|nr:alanine--tRNA ligase-related protein [Alphaproteobacteria bacterium]